MMINNVFVSMVVLSLVFGMTRDGFSASALLNCRWWESRRNDRLGKYLSLASGGGGFKKARCHRGPAPEPKVDGCALTDKSELSRIRHLSFGPVGD